MRDRTKKKWAKRLGVKQARATGKIGKTTKSEGKVGETTRQYTYAGGAK